MEWRRRKMLGYKSGDLLLARRSGTLRRAGEEWGTGCLKRRFYSSLRGRSPKQSIDNQYPGLLRLMARNDDCDF